MRSTCCRILKRTDIHEGGGKEKSIEEKGEEDPFKSIYFFDFYRSSRHRFDIKSIFVNFDCPPPLPPEYNDKSNRVTSEQEFDELVVRKVPIFHRRYSYNF